MRIGNGGRYDFEFSGGERERLLLAGDVLADLCEVMEKKNYSVLIMGYPEDEQTLMVDSIRDLSEQLHEIADAWAIE